MKKAFVRTEIIKYLNKVEKENGKALSIQDIFNLLPKLYEQLKSEPENQLQNLTYEEFNRHAQVGLMIAQQKQQFANFRF